MRHQMIPIPQVSHILEKLLHKNKNIRHGLLNTELKGFKTPKIGRIDVDSVGEIITTDSIMEPKVGIVAKHK